MSICAVIPARGGSKGVPRKNVAPFLGRPLIAHTIEAARHARGLDRIIVSTDDEEIARIATSFGAEVPFVRPASLSGDATPTSAVLQHALGWLRDAGDEVEALVTLQPTSPFRRADHIDRAIDLFRASGADAVVSVCLVEHSPYWMYVLNGDRLQPVVSDGASYTRRQDLPPVFRLNGAVYVTRSATIASDGSVLGPDTRAIVMSAEESVDLDTPEDFDRAERLAREMRK